MAMNLGLDPRDPRYQQMVAQMIREGKMPPSAGMKAGMASSGFAEEATGGRMLPEQGQIPDFTGQERKIKNQRDYANSLRGKTAKGKTVGPLGVYMAPNWGESLAAAGSEVLGGYLSGKADRADEALDEQRGLEKTRIADQEAARHAETRGDTELNQAHRAERAAVSDTAAAGAITRDETAEGVRVAENTTKEDVRVAELEEKVAREAQARVDKLKAEKDASELSHEQEKELLELEKELEDRGFNTEGLNGDQMAAISALGSATERKEARLLLGTGKEMGNTIVRAEKLLADGGNWNSVGREMAAEAAGSVPLVGTALGNVVKGGYSDEEKAIRGLVANGVEAFRRSRAGANFTAMEKAMGADWDPTAEAIGSKEALKRMKALERYMKDNLGYMGVPFGEESSGVSDEDKAKALSGGATMMWDPAQKKMVKIG